MRTSTRSVSGRFVSVFDEYAQKKRERVSGQKGYEDDRRWRGRHDLLSYTFGGGGCLAPLREEKWEYGVGCLY